ncbi:Ca-activated chloride channel family protein [Yoonia maricola]|uniref:Ca-activated chloride channel family protein n=1 Tax=Yoonia maricola TaxID=420999 RepID=A0A2M8W2Q6_9RHOB|nr:VWA domain-containing protein [Yoonia maricola]PJI85199.1 Ca-activated chloride channel family protein [Yoonia maricola]
MTDDLNDLKAIMDQATPSPDTARRAENIALAQKNFNDLQGSRQDVRPTAVTGPKGLWTGVKTMLNTTMIFATSKGGLTATTALVACGFLVLTPQGQDLLRPPSAPQITMTEFDSTTMQPRLENGPMTAEELSRSEIIQEAPSGAEGQILLGPLETPTEDLDFTDRSDAAPRVLPQLRDDAVVPQMQEAEIVESLPEVRSRMTENNLSAPLASPATTGTTAPEVDAERETVVPPSSSATFGQLSSGGLYPSSEQQTPSTELQEAETIRVPGTDVLDLIDDALGVAEPDTEAFPQADNNPLKITADDPVSTFSIDVDTAAYAVVRSSLSRGQLPPAAAVRIEELMNYFPYDYPAPDAGEAPFRPTVTTFQTPWNADTQLVHIALQGQMPEIAERPPLNLVFLIDTSGSMDDPTKLPLLKQSFRLMLDQLRPEDQVAIVEYAGSAGEVLAPTNASERTTILQAIQSLGAGGSTNGQGGLEQAYSVAETMRADGEVNRVILATDGDFNVGLNNPDALKDFIADKRDTGTYLSVLGFGHGNLDDATMQALAQNGNGTAAYIDTLSEAQKVLVDQLSGALFPIAGDVKVQVEFNPAQVAEYRLIGYETRALNREDFNNDTVDAGELGAGHAVTAIYEVTPVGSPAQLSDPLRYAPNTVAATSDELGFLKLRYKEPGDAVSQLIETPITGSSIPGTEANFAAAIAGFGQLLRDEAYLGDWGYDQAIALANANRGDDAFGYRTEAVQLMRLAQSLSR